MNRIVKVTVFVMTLLTLCSPQARTVSAHVSLSSSKVKLINTGTKLLENGIEKDYQAIHFIDDNDPMFNDVFYYLGVDEDLDRLMFEKFPLLTIGVTKKYTDASLIPETIYYHSFGYTGYIPKVSLVKQTEEGLFEVEYIGLVFRDGPVDD